MFTCSESYHHITVLIIKFDFMRALKGMKVYAFLVVVVVEAVAAANDSGSMKLKSRYSC